MYEMYNKPFLGKEDYRIESILDLGQIPVKTEFCTEGIKDVCLSIESRINFHGPLFPRYKR